MHFCRTRFIFTLADLDTVAPAYKHFCSCLEELCREESPVGSFQAEQIPVDFPTSFEFERSSHMVSSINIWFSGPVCFCIYPCVDWKGTVACYISPETWPRRCPLTPFKKTTLWTGGLMISHCEGNSECLVVIQRYITIYIPCCGSGISFAVVDSVPR